MSVFLIENGAAFKVAHDTFSEAVVSSLPLVFSPLCSMGKLT